MKTQALSADVLVIDADTQSRVAISDSTVEDYAEIIADADGWPFEPLDVYHDGSRHMVADGFHRTLAALQAGRASIPCRVHKGTARDARIFAMTANDKHGLRMTRADKRACVEWLLDHGGKMTQAEIAKTAGVTKRTVERIVAERRVDATPTLPTMSVSDPSSPGPQKSPASPAQVTAQARQAAAELTDTAAAGDLSSPAAEGSQQTDAIPVTAAAPSTSASQASIVKDAAGRDVPPQFREAHQLGVQLLSIGRELDRFRQYAKDLHGHPGGEWLRLQEIDEDIRALKGHFQLARYYTVCVQCAGAGCKTCEKIGYLPEYLKATVTT